MDRHTTIQGSKEIWKEITEWVKSKTKFLLLWKCHLKKALVRPWLDARMILPRPVLVSTRSDTLKRGVTKEQMMEAIQLAGRLWGGATQIHGVR
jgi:hypothetical protein